MTEKVIEARSGKYGRVQITLPINTKKKMIDWKNQSGLKQSEFFRTALMIGAAQVAKGISSLNLQSGAICKG
ncbi:MAG: hypothetical protein JEZ06_18660 [Anaerolineaceae bacterium]|nr:hypothetical protein [Anaerolineaceae bacterium]